MNLQNKIIYETENFRPLPKYPTYPFYHIGDYLEESFFKKFISSENLRNDLIYLPIFWTTLYNDNVIGVQKFLDSLDKNLSYFTVCQHDDAVKENLPPKTIVYSAGGNRGDVPIPLVCSNIPKDLIPKEVPKKKLASFVGSMTHPIRNLIYNQYKSDGDFLFLTKNWTPKISHNDFKNFSDATSISKFTLCPRGYGKSSFRLYETFQLNSIPVYISDYFWLPFEEELKWSEFCVMIKSNQIPDLKNILQSIDDVTYKKMLTKGKEIWFNYFEINKTCEKILNFYEN
jgi:hypothetical protein